MEFEKVRDIIVETLDCDAEQVTLEASLADDLGADSLASVELVGRDWKTGHVWTICHYQFYLDNQFVCFQCDRLLSTGSLFLRLHFRYSRFHW